LKPKEIILQAFRGEKTGRVPVALIGGGMWSVAHEGTTLEELSTDSERMSDLLIKMVNILEGDIVYAGSGYPNVPAVALGGKIKFRDLGAVDLAAPVASSEEEVDQLDLSRIDSNEILDTIRKAFRTVKERIGEDYLVTMTAWGPFTLGARIVGEETFIKAIIKDPAFAEKVLDRVTRLLMRLYTPLVEEGNLELITLGDPTASGDLISRKQFERFAIPYLKKFTDWAKSRNVSTLLHICGNTTDRLDLFPMTGTDCISLDHKTDLAQAKKVLHGKMCFAGNIDPVKILLRGSVQDVEKACHRVIETAGTEGGFVLMPGCDIPPTVPHENLRKFFQVAREWKH